MKRTSDYVLDVTGYSCPMPIIQTKQRMNTMNIGEILEIRSTDPSAKVDLIAWATSNHEKYLGTIENEHYSIHFIKKTSSEQEEKTSGKILSLDSLEAEIKRLHGRLIDVREQEEYANGHIPGARSIPLAECKSEAHTLNKHEPLFLICQSGNRSGMAQKVFEELGFTQVFNVVPGMGQWLNQTKQGLEE